MRLVALLFLVGGLALAGGAAFFASEHFKNVEALMAQQIDTEPHTVRVIAAKEPLSYGDRIDLARAKKSLRWVEWPKDAVPEGAFTTDVELLGEGRTETRTVLRAIEPGELILKSKVTGFGMGTRMATQVKDGMRAVTIPINAVTGGGGHISPGDHVDIEWTRNNGGQISSVIIMQNVKVIATDQSLDSERNRALLAQTATVEVNPVDAQKLRLAQQAGTLALFLRGTNEALPTDGAEANMQPIELSDLPGVKVAVPEPEPEPEPEAIVEDKGYQVRVRKGSDVQSVPFEAVD